MHCDVVELADQLRRQVGIVGDVPVHLLVRRRRHLLAVALGEVDDARADGGEAHERAGARVPQLRVEAFLLFLRRRRGRGWRRRLPDAGRGRRAHLRRPEPKPNLSSLIHPKPHPPLQIGRILVRSRELGDRHGVRREREWE
uniref:Uncharacterized protein n=1 Tax=Arundo donax TaxID=35708 RepID=A0A0A8ZPH0_ARUDO